VEGQFSGFRGFVTTPLSFAGSLRRALTVTATCLPAVLDALLQLPRRQVCLPSPVTLGGDLGWWNAAVCATGVALASAYLRTRFAGAEQRLLSRRIRALRWQAGSSACAYSPRGRKLPYMRQAFHANALFSAYTFRRIRQRLFSTGCVNSAVRWHAHSRRFAYERRLETRLAVPHSRSLLGLKDHFLPAEHLSTTCTAARTALAPLYHISAVMPAAPRPGRHQTYVVTFCAAVLPLL